VLDEVSRFDPVDPPPSDEDEPPPSDDGDEPPPSDDDEPPPPPSDEDEDGEDEGDATFSPDSPFVALGCARESVE
jgi:hypothetical protein